MEGNLIRKTADNHGTELEYYVSNRVSEKATLILSMGIWEPACRAFPLITRLTGRHCLVLSYRGRGGSGTPESGFDWPQHASDLACMLEKEASNKPVFLGFSKGVSYLLGYLSSNPAKARGIILIDFPAIHAKAENGYAEFWGNKAYNGFKLGSHITARTLKGIESESTYREFYTDLRKMKCPVWVFRGTDATSGIPSELTEADMLNYEASVPQLTVVDFEYSGHMIMDEELGKTCCQIQRILKQIDAGE